MKIAVTSASGLEAVVKRELFKLGVEDAPAINGSIMFDGDVSLVAKCNLFLRSASRVLIVLGEFKASSFDELFDNVFDIDWQNYLPSDARIIVNAKCVLSTIHAISVTQSITKKAICEKLAKTLKNANLSEDGERYKVEVSIFKDFCTVSLDTSGEGLHRRGYRTLVGDAPLKENVASAMFNLSYWNPDRPFADLFCGSGTLPIEAGLLAKRVPAGAFRDFDFLHWKNFSNGEFQAIKKDAMSSLNLDPKASIVGYDIDPKALALAKIHAKNAGVENFVRFEEADMRTFSTTESRGIVISNPPYGERLDDREEIESLYHDYGKIAKKYPDWCFYTLTPVTDFERLFGKKADKKRKLYNGNIECFYYSHLAPKPIKEDDKK